VAVSGLGAAMTVSGIVLVLSGVRNIPVKDTLTSLLAGKLPAANPTGPVTIGIADNSGTSGGSSGSSGAAASAAPGNTGAATASAAANQATAKLLAVSLGHPTWVTGQEWADWVSLWNQESGWSTTAVNPSSGATGIPQLNPSAHAVPAGWNGPTASVVQITWGINYIAERYGSPSAAWQFNKDHGLQGY
jgi:hypothetical protein